jgi:Peptide methionine sulfoxide reductase
VAGVDRCIVGYAGGIQPNPNYGNIQDYTEALLIEFDPSVTSYTELLELWRSLHTPYPSKRQYRSAVMYLSEEQAKAAQEFTKGEKYVDVEPVTKFYLAEEYHQDYLKKMTASLGFWQVAGGGVARVCPGWNDKRGRFLMAAFRHRQRRISHFTCQTIVFSYVLRVSVRCTSLITEAILGYRAGVLAVTRTGYWRRSEDCLGPLDNIAGL